MKYYYSMHEDGDDGDGVFANSVDANSLGEAIEIAREELSVENEGYNTTFYVAESEPIDPLGYIHAEMLLEHIQCNLYDDVGEAAEDWPCCNREEEDLLTDMLRDTFEIWMSETNNEIDVHRLTSFKECKF
jgi:hypothetical protein